MAENNKPKRTYNKQTNKMVGEENTKMTNSTEGKPPVKKKLTIRDIPLTELVEVKSCVYGTLVYISPRSGYKVVWTDFGQSEYLTVEEVISMRNGSRSFFENHWVTIEGENAQDVIDFLQLNKYYQKFSNIDDIDNIFDDTPENVESYTKSLSDSMKETVARRAYSLIAEGTLDSKKVIDALEKGLGYSLEVV